nr:immunoglobulin heavy chain junction region [Mus musculus]
CARVTAQAKGYYFDYW